MASAWPLFVLALSLALTHSVANQTYIGTDDTNNLHFNSSSTGTVFIDGVDVVSELEWLRAMVDRLRATSEPTMSTSRPTTSGPTISEPTGAPTAPTGAPASSAPSGSPTGSPATPAPVARRDCDGIFVRNQGDWNRLDDGRMQACTHINGHLKIYSTTSVASFGSRFRNLQVISGNLDIYRNEALASLGEAFHSLTSVGGHLIFAGNLRLVRAPSAAFARMTHIGEYIEWYGQGGLNTGTNSAWGDHDRGCCSNFCDSIRAQLCTVHPNPHGTNGWRDNGDDFDADSCCVAYCANRWSGNRCVN